MTTLGNVHVDAQNLASHGGSGVGQSPIPPPQLASDTTPATNQLQMLPPVEDSTNLLLDLSVPEQRDPPMRGAPLGGRSVSPVVKESSTALPPAGSTLLPSAAGQTQYLSMPGGPTGPVPTIASDRLAFATQAEDRKVMSRMTGVNPGEEVNVATQPLRPRTMDYRPSSSLSMDSIMSGRSERSRRTLPQRPPGPGYQAQVHKTEDEDVQIVLSSADGHRGPVHSSPVEFLAHRLSTLNLVGAKERARTPELSPVSEVKTQTSIQAQVDAMDSATVILTDDGFTVEQVALVKELMLDAMNQHEDKTALTLAAQQDLHSDQVRRLKAEVQKWTDTANRCWDDKELRKLQQDQLMTQRADEHAVAVSALKAEWRAEVDRTKADLGKMALSLS